MKDDFIYGDQEFEEQIKKENSKNICANYLKGRLNKKKLINNNMNINMHIMNKTEIIKEEIVNEDESENDEIFMTESIDESFEDESKSNCNKVIKNGKLYLLKIIDIQVISQNSSTSNPTINPISNQITTNNYGVDDRIFRYDAYPLIEMTMPLVSPINPNKLYPPSTRNYFNIDLLHEGNYYIPMSMHGINIVRPNTFCTNGYSSTTPTGNEKINYNFSNIIQGSYTPNKEVNLQNKILINENADNIFTSAIKKEEVKLDKDGKENFKSQEKEVKIQNINEFPREEDYLLSDKKKLKRPSLDLSLVNESETGKIFFASVTNSHNISNPTSTSNIESNEVKKNIATSTSEELNKNINKIDSLNVKQISSQIVSPYEEKSVNSLKINSLAPGLINKFKLNTKSLTPENNLAISPKSAFVKMK
jgi:hypothetical protein